MSKSDPELNTRFQTTVAGRLEFWQTRVFLQDALGGFYALREQMTREIGPEFTADILYRAGFSTAERLMDFVVHQETGGDGPASLELALSQLMQAGYGVIGVDAERRRIGELGIRLEGSVEGEMMSDRAGRTGYVCDYMRGLLRGIVQYLPKSPGLPSGMLECVEISCVANDDSECRFVIAPPEHLAQHGYRTGDNGYSSVRETLLRLNRQLEDVLEAAKRDSLTGLFNRAHFESMVRNRIEFANRRTDTLAVAMVDVDKFKQVNDTQGHAMGDMALRQVGNLLASQARDTDIVARYGGDEFAWLMPGTSVEAALAVAERIRRLVQEAQAQMEVPITVSIGIAACPDDADSMADLIDRADAAMYLSKNNGGNQVNRYQLEEDHREAAQKGIRRSHPRPETAAPANPPSVEESVLRVDLND